MSSTGDSYGFSVLEILFLDDSYKILCSIVAPNLLVDMVPVNSIWHSDEERANGGHLTHGAIQFCKRL